ncbi:MAG TPA: hypothetical protein PLD47_14310 [Aggregatilineales bacterium]|nr:hypothetical protein [Anaerolineales bacterium]HRE48896.1 hypothetical protein [Aggregatilineales bacterium]
MDQTIAQIIPIVQLVLGSLMKVGDAGLVGKLREAGALGKFLSEAQEKFKGNALVEGLLKALPDQIGEMGQSFDVKHFDVLQTTQALGGLDGILKDSGEQGKQVKQFIYELAERFASAAGGGIFGSGQKISEAESAFLSDLKGRLGL